MIGDNRWSSTNKECPGWLRWRPPRCEALGNTNFRPRYSLHLSEPEECCLRSLQMGPDHQPRWTYRPLSTPSWTLDITSHQATSHPSYMMIPLLLVRTSPPLPLLFLVTKPSQGRPVILEYQRPQAKLLQKIPLSSVSCINVCTQLHNSHAQVTPPLFFLHQ